MISMLNNDWNWWTDQNVTAVSKLLEKLQKCIGTLIKDLKHRAGLSKSDCHKSKVQVQLGLNIQMPPSTRAYYS
jgi:hypothetical protein